jgi:TatD DNase family protein
MLIDTHCHLDAAEFDPDRGPVIDEAIRRRASSASSCPPWKRRTSARWPAWRRGCRRCATPWASTRCTPRRRARNLDLLEDAVARAMDDPRFLGIGEIGLDHFVPGLDRARQLHFFVAQLRIEDLRVAGDPACAPRPDAVLQQLRRWRPRSGIAHAFNGSRQQAETFLGLGFVLGFGGALAGPAHCRSAGWLRELPAQAHAAPETDAPDIPPAWIGKGRNAPGELASIGGTAWPELGVGESGRRRTSGGHRRQRVQGPAALT